VALFVTAQAKYECLAILHACVVHYHNASHSTAARRLAHVNNEQHLRLQNVGQTLGKNTMTFAVNVTTDAPMDSANGNLWDTFSPLSKLLTIASVNNKAQFETDSKGDGAYDEARKVRGHCGNYLCYCCVCCLVLAADQTGTVACVLFSKATRRLMLSRFA
jgi:hypothetical protein